MGQRNPPATGVLPIALEEATKALQVLLYGGKEYVCVMQLHGHVPEDSIREVVSEFVGEIYQRPPLRSSVKRETRRRMIHYSEILEIKDKFILLRVGCQAGTYIRKLCYDIGEALGCGAHMRELRRIRVGPFTEDNGLVRVTDVAYAYSLFTEKGDDSLLRKVIQPVENCLTLLPKVFIRDTAVDALCHGAQLAAPGIVRVERGIEIGDVIGVYTLKGEIVVLMTANVSSEEMIDMERGLVAKPMRVIMTPGTYPSKWKKSSAKDN